MTRMLMLAAFAAMLSVAACGHDHDKDGGHTHGNGKTPSGVHTHDHGDAHSLGHKELENGYHVGAARVGELTPGKEGVFEVHVRKDAVDLSDAGVTGWLGDAEGVELTRPAGGEWMSDENVYDIHMMLPPQIPEGTKLWVRVRHAGTDMTTSFSLAGE